MSVLRDWPQIPTIEIMSFLGAPRIIVLLSGTMYRPVPVVEVGIPLSSITNSRLFYTCHIVVFLINWGKTKTHMVP